MKPDAPSASSASPPPSVPTSPAGPSAGELAFALDQSLAAHLRRFQRAHQRARAGAGPSVFGSDRAPDHWTYGYALRGGREFHAEVAELLLNCPSGPELAPEAIQAAGRARVREFARAVLEVLEHEENAPPANEFGLRPAAEARRILAEELAGLERALFTGIARGRIDPRLRAPSGPWRAFIAWIGGGDRLVLAIAVVIVLLLVYNSF